MGKGGISSDDPDAVEKLRAKLARLQAVQEAMKKANAAIRRHRGDEAAQVAAIVEIEGFTEDQARQIIQPDYMNRVGFAPFTLQNNNANIHRIAARIKELEQAAERTETTRSGPGYIYREDPQENRAMFVFDGKPAKETRDMLKRQGFRWSPTRNAWVRQLTGNATWAAKEVIRYLDQQSQG